MEIKKFLSWKMHILYEFLTTPFLFHEIWNSFLSLINILRNFNRQIKIINPLMW